MNHFPPQPPELNEDDFYNKYKFRDSPDGSVLWERLDILPLIKSGEITDNNVWSVVDVEDGRVGAIAGWHIVNVFAYMVTQETWSDGRECMMFDSPEEVYIHNSAQLAKEKGIT